MQSTMNKDERDKLRHEVYTLWYHEKDEEKKAIYQKMLDLISFTDEMRARMRSVTNLFQEML